MESIYFLNIVYIRNKDTNEIISKDRCSIQKITSMYSNTKEPIFKIVIDSIPISRNNKLCVKYNCNTCKIQQEITLNLYIRKVNKNISRCDACKNKSEIKCKNQSEFMKNNIADIVSKIYVKKYTTVIKKATLDEYIQKSLDDWEKEEYEFKEQYFLCHLSIEDFERIRSKIISINNGKFNNISDWDYFPTYRIYNQTRYTPMLIHKTDKCVEKPLYITFSCDNCSSLFIHRDIEIIKNHHKLHCQECSLTNRIYKIRKYQCKDKSIIMWQSIPERRFIEWCEEHNIIIKNGPRIEYNHNDKIHIYKVDFELPEHNSIIEIKDNHCWHKQQVESGKFGAKESAAKNWCIEHNYVYNLIFPKTLQKFKDSILKIL
jgi:hypothetical protein